MNQCFRCNDIEFGTIDIDEFSSRLITLCRKHYDELRNEIRFLEASYKNAQANIRDLQAQLENNAKNMHYKSALKEKQTRGARFACEECAIGRDCELHDPPHE